MINRNKDLKSTSYPNNKRLPPLPIIDWSLIGQTKPEWVDIGEPDKHEKLPKADIVVMTWTAAEWLALDHVFANSDKEAHRTSKSFRDEWHLRGDSQFVKGAYNLWGFYRMVKITNANGIALNVLLWKSSTHLAHPPYCKGVMEMVELILKEASPKRLYTIGTAGGASVSERLGDTAITNAGHIIIKKPENKACDLNGKNVACDSWFPILDLLPEVQDKLLFDLNKVVNYDELGYMLERAINDPEKGNPDWKKFKVEDLINEAIDPANLGNPKGLDKKGIPLLTTDFYYIAEGDDAAKYSALEMDDAVVGYVANEFKTDFVFVRNISDPVVPSVTKSGEGIPVGLRDGWSGEIYQNFGLYTSMNGALITWATIAGDTTIKNK